MAEGYASSRALVSPAAPSMLRARACAATPWRRAAPRHVAAKLCLGLRQGETQGLCGKAKVQVGATRWRDRGVFGLGFVETLLCLVLPWRSEISAHPSRLYLRLLRPVIRPCRWLAALKPKR